jgi:hypothetical protein
MLRAEIDSPKGAQAQAHVVMCGACRGKTNVVSWEGVERSTETRPCDKIKLSCNTKNCCRLVYSLPF